jgi:hypothetical protein
LNGKSNDLRRTVRKGRHHELKNGIYEAAQTLRDDGGLANCYLGLAVSSAQPLSSSFPVSSPSMSFLAIFLLGEERDLKIDRLYVVITLAMERGK